MSHEVAQQVSKERKFLKKPMSIENSKNKWDLWKKLCAVTTDVNCSSMPSQVNVCKWVWSTFNSMVQIIIQSSTTFEERVAFQHDI